MNDKGPQRMLQIEDIKNRVFKPATTDNPPKKTRFWTTTKDEYIERLKRLPTLYHRDIWNYLQAYIIRGKGTGTSKTWNVCYNLRTVIGLLAANISVPNISRNTGISEGKVKQILKDLNNNSCVIKYSSKSSSKKNNTNIYIIGFENTGITEGNIWSAENYIVDANNKVRQSDRKKLLSLFDLQLKIKDNINILTKELAKIQDHLFYDKSDRA